MSTNKSELISIAKVKEEVRIFKLEYPNYNDEIVYDYMQLMDDYSPEEKRMFLEMLGY